MTVDLEGFRRRFIQGLADEEDEVMDRQGRIVERRTAVETFDPDAGTFVFRPGFEFTGGRGEPLDVRIGLDALDQAWPSLVRWGREAFGAEDEETAAFGYLGVVLDEAVESDVLEGATDIELSPCGIFQARHSKREPSSDGAP